MGCLFRCCFGGGSDSRRTSVSSAESQEGPRPGRLKRWCSKILGVLNCMTHPATLSAVGSICLSVAANAAFIGIWAPAAFAVAVPAAIAGGAFFAAALISCAIRRYCCKGENQNTAQASERSPLINNQPSSYVDGNESD